MHVQVEVIVYLQSTWKEKIWIPNRKKIQQLSIIVKVQSIIQLHRPDQKEKVDKQAISLEILLNNYLNLFIDYEPISFQRKMTLRIKGVGPIIFGYSDIIGKRDDKNLIIDIKTSGKQMSQPSPTHRTQMMFYCLSLMKMDKLTEIPDLELHYLVKTREPKINIVKVDVRESDLYHLISSIREHHWRIQQGFYPLNRNSVWCSETGCDHYEKCHSDCSMTIENTMDQVIIEEDKWN